LKSEHKADGGWQEISAMKGSNAFATGQVLHAFKNCHPGKDCPTGSHGEGYMAKRSADPLPEFGRY